MIVTKEYVKLLLKFRDGSNALLIMSLPLLFTVTIWML